MPGSSTRTRQRSLRLPHRLWEALEQRAEMRGTSVAEEVHQILACALYGSPISVAEAREPIRNGQDLPSHGKEKP